MGYLNPFAVSAVTAVQYGRCTVHWEKTMAPWDPECYLTYQKERFAPFEDLLPLIRVRSDMSVVDLGCGTGELTLRLAEWLPGSRVLGIDTSEEMLAKARELERPGLHFERRDLRALEGRWDLVFSNAAIHWAEDHRELVPRLLSCAAPGGQIALQLPSNHHHVAHRMVIETAAEKPFKTALEGWVRQSPVLPMASYAEILYQAGAEDMRIFEKVYPHIMENADALATWLSGTTLVPYLDRLNEVYRTFFMQVLRRKLRTLWPSGPVFYPFRRIFLSAFRPEEAA